MKPGTIWRKTLIFSWIQLGLGLLTFFLCAIIGGGALLIIRNVEMSVGAAVGAGCGAVLIALVIYFVIMGRFGYGIKMGQLAIVERAHGGNDVPNNPVEFSKDVISARFGNARKYYTLSRNISTARRQVTRVLARGFSLDKDVPDMKGHHWLLFLFCMPSLRFVDECCLTYALRRNDYEVNAACVDALTILVQDWNAFIKRSLRLSIFVYVVCLVLWALLFLPVFFLLKSMAIDSMFWLVISFFLMITIKVAFLDSYTLTKIVCGFLDISKDPTIPKTNYVKLDSWSKMYAKLRKRAEKEAENADDAQFAEERKAAREEAKALAKKEEETPALPEDVPDSEVKSLPADDEDSAAESESASEDALESEAESGEQSGSEDGSKESEEKDA